MEKFIVRSVDVGYGYTKFVLGRTPQGDYVCESFPSVVAFAQKKTLGGGFFAERSTLTVLHNGVEYEVGPDVLLATSAYGSRNLDLGYVQTDTYQILLKGALKRIGLPRIDVLVLGAPVATYDQAREYLRRAFSGRIALDRAQEVVVGKVLVLPQPLGGYAWHGHVSGSYSRIRGQLNLLIDPGYFTLDWLVARGTTIAPARSGSHPAGMSALVRAIASEISRETGEEVTSLLLWESIERALYAEEPLHLDGRPYDLTRHLGAVNQLLAQAAEVLASRVGDAKDIQNVILVGGPARLYEPALKRALHGKLIQIAQDPQFANVKGFQRVGEDIAERL